MYVYICIHPHKFSSAVRMASSGMAMAYAMIVKGYTQEKARSHETSRSADGMMVDS